jgi:RNA polymerase sigma-70 factor (ECF subfamily)
MTLFPTTRWAEILEQRADPQRRRQLLGQLARIYREPLLVYARCQGLDAASAEDAVQGFVTTWIERDLAARLDPAKGRLRSYLRTALRRYLADRHEHATAQKRGGVHAVAPQPLTDIEPFAVDHDVTPDQAYDRAFARRVLAHAFAELEAEFTSGRRTGPFAAVREAFSPEHAGATHAELAARYQMPETQLASFLHRARGRFRELVRQQVRDLVADPAQTDAELRSLLAALS